MGKPTHISEYPFTEFIGDRKRTRGTETSKYPEEKKSIEIPRVVASEKGTALKRYDANRISWKSESKKVKIL